MYYSYISGIQHWKIRTPANSGRFWTCIGPPNHSKCSWCLFRIEEIESKAVWCDCVPAYLWKDCVFESLLLRLYICHVKTSVYMLDNTMLFSVDLVFSNLKCSTVYVVSHLDKGTKLMTFIQIFLKHLIDCNTVISCRSRMLLV